MKKITLSLFILASFFSLSGQENATLSRPVNCNICLNGVCNPEYFSLSAGNTYTFSTDLVVGGFYTWSVSGPGLSIVGSRNQSSVQVQVNSNEPGRICITKSVDGQDPCCFCVPVNPPPPECPILFSYTLKNNPNVPLVWCCDYDANFLYFDFINGNGTATVIIRDANFQILNTYYNLPGGTDYDWPNGIVINNNHPPVCGEYWLQIINDCNPQDVIGGHFEVVQCQYQKPNTGISMEGVSMEVYPNPVENNNLTVKISGITAERTKANSKIAFRLIDVAFTKQAGTWIFDGSTGQYNINTSGISKGTYLLIADIEGKSLSKKVVIQ